MRRTLRLLLALSSTLAFVGVMAPNASALHGFTLATHHQALPTNDLTPSMSIDGVCVVNGSVAFHNVPLLSLGEHPNHGFYWAAVSIDCVDQHNPPNSPTSLTGRYDVEAHGDSDGPFHAGFTLHGETAEGMSWSHGGHYLGSNALCDAPTALDPTMIPAGEGCGFITVNGVIPASPAASSNNALNYVKFMRSGVQVNAWGLIVWDQAGLLSMCFNADLNLTFTVFHTGDLSGNPMGYGVQGILKGAATLLLLAAGDHHCG